MKRFTNSAKRILAFALALAVSLSVVVSASTYPAYADETRVGVVTTNGGTLTVRTGAGTSNPSIGTLTRGTMVDIVGQENAADGAVWYKIVYGSGHGFVHSGYITLVEITEDEDFESTISGFPESYKDELRTLHSLYPNWVFVPVYTNTEWADAYKAECALGLNLVDGDSISSYKSTMPGAYDWTTGKWKDDYDSGDWVQASEQLIAYYLDPRNYLDSKYIFTFLDFAYDESQTVEGLAAIMKGTFMEQGFTENGVNYTYPEVVLEAGKQTGMNPYVIATIFRNELGVNGSNSISGTVSGYQGYYNYYNIGAYAANGMTAIQRGLWYAKGGSNGATSYNRPWNSRVKAMIGGAMFYVTNYISVGQDTAYFKKFNVAGQNMYNHQYMTNVQGAASEGATIAKAYSEEARASALVFKIPVFNNMPEVPATKPTGDGSPNNKLSSLAVESYDLTPNFNTDTLNYDLVVEETAKQITITAATYDSTATVEGTGTFELQPGLNTFEIKVTAQNGQTRTYVIDVDGVPFPLEPDEPGEEQPPEEVDPDAPAFTTQLTVSESAKTISGVPEVPCTAETLIAVLGVTNGSVQVLGADGSAVTGSVGTGSVIKLLDAAGEVVKEYTLVIYGDVNGDGKFTSLDALRVQKHMVGMITLTGAHFTACDATRDGRVSSLDALRIQKTVIKTASITQ